MKRLFALALVFILLYNTLGYYLVFSYNRFLLRKEIHGLIRNHRLDDQCIILTFAFPQKTMGFSRINQTEFVYKGVLYDIVSEEIHEGGITIRCLADQKESELIAGFTHSFDLLHDRNHPGHSRHLAFLLQHMIQQALPETIVAGTLPFPSMFTHANRFFPLASPDITPENPPPETV